MGGGRKSELRSCVNREVGDTGKKVRSQELCVQGGGRHREESQKSGAVCTGRWATQGRKLRSCVYREVGDTGKKVRSQELCVQGGGRHGEESSGAVCTGRWATQGRKSGLRSCVDREVGLGSRSLSHSWPVVDVKHRERRRVTDTRHKRRAHVLLRFRFVPAAQIIMHSEGYLWVRVISLWGLRPVSVA